jgi:hypothetical protein
MRDLLNGLKSLANRRSFLKKGVAAAGTATVGGTHATEPGFQPPKSNQRSSKWLNPFPDDECGPEAKSGRLTPGNAAMLRFAAQPQSGARLLGAESTTNSEESKTAQSQAGVEIFRAALQVLDSDMSQYIPDNTDDELTPQNSSTSTWLRRLRI